MDKQQPPMIPEAEAAMRIEAMAAEYRQIIAALTERCIALAVANAVANKTK